MPLLTRMILIFAPFYTEITPKTKKETRKRPIYMAFRVFHTAAGRI